MADPCLTLANELAALQETKGTIIEGQIGGGDKGSGPVRKPNPNDPELKEINRQIGVKSKQLEQCLNQPIPAAPMTISATRISSIDRNDVKVLVFSETGEPYLLVYALDVPRLSPKVNLPKPKVTKIEWSGLDEGESLAAPPNVLWGMAGAPAPLTSPDDVILLVALVEHDDTKTDFVRTLVEDQMFVTMTTNITSVGNRAEFVRRLINGMNGAIATATLVAAGPPNPDDPIGGAQELRLTRQDLSRAYQFGSVMKSLAFSGDDPSYGVSFTLRPA